MRLQFFFPELILHKYSVGGYLWDVRLPDEDKWIDTQSKTARRVRNTWEIAKDNVRCVIVRLDAAQRWGEHYAQVLETGGFARGVASPCHFFHKDLETYILVHGDDFFIVGRQDGRKHALSLLRGAYELSKVVTLGPESSQSQTASFLGRTLTL